MRLIVKLLFHKSKISSDSSFLSFSVLLKYTFSKSNSSGAFSSNKSSLEIFWKEPLALKSIFRIFLFLSLDLGDKLTELISRFVLESSPIF